MPDDLKIARVVPIFKTGSRTSLSNYRPISLLSVFNKIFEKLMYNRLIQFLEKNLVFSDSKFVNSYRKLDQQARYTAILSSGITFAILSWSATRPCEKEAL